MRKLLCRWSFLLDKPAARDAPAFKSSVDVQSYQTYLDSVYEEHQKDIIEMQAREDSSCDGIPQNA
eukprot:7576649-Prorocentrum_lima.AAC.1